MKRVRTFRSTAFPQAHVTLGSVERASRETAAEVTYRVTTVEETASTANDTVSSFDDLGSKEY